MIFRYLYECVCVGIKINVYAKRGREYENVQIIAMLKISIQIKNILQKYRK